MPAAQLFGIGDGGMRHGLFVLTAICGEGVARSMQRLAQTRHVAMAKNAPAPGKEGQAILGHLRRQIADHGLCGGQADGGHGCGPFGAALSHAAQRAA